jgi:hypothetical protein
MARIMGYSPSLGEGEHGSSKAGIRAHIHIVLSSHRINIMGRFCFATPILPSKLIVGRSGNRMAAVVVLVAAVVMVVMVMMIQSIIRRGKV